MRISIILYCFMQGSTLFAQNNEILCSRKHSATVFERAAASEQLNHYDVRFYFLDLTAHNQSTAIAGNVKILATALTDLTTWVVELDAMLSVDSVYVNGNKSTFTHSNDLITVGVLPVVPAGQNFEGVIYYHGVPVSTGFSGIFNRADQTYKNRITWTLSEPFSAKEWFPCKQVLTDKADSVYFFITTPDSLKAGSNGLLTQVSHLGNGWVRYEWKSRYPIAYYLISMAVGNYVEYNTEADLPGGKKLPIQNYMYNTPGNAAVQNFQSHLDLIDEMIELFSAQFGVYPFQAEKYGHAMAPSGAAMEHQTMSTMPVFTFTLDAHELGHQWFGDQVTCGTWQDIWINEGFASYSEYLALENLFSKETADNWMLGAHNSVKSAPGGSVYIPEAQATDINRIFNSRLTYRKGAALVHMIRYMINDDDLFFTVLQNFQDEFKHKTAIGEDFKRVAEDETGISFQDFFSQWYYGEGFPTYTIQWNQLNDSIYILPLQSTSVAVTPFFSTPLEFKVNFSGGGDSLIRISPQSDGALNKLKLVKMVSSIEFDPGKYILKNAGAVSRNEALGVTGLENFETPPFQIFPNPATRQDVRVLVEAECDVEIRDSTGRLIEFYSGLSKEQNIPSSTWPQGVYFVKVSAHRYPKPGFFKLIVQ